jgi:predicted negative regulator of RcsB-dependent stress response
MDTRELTASDYLFKLWPWIEANLKRIAYAVGAAAVLVFLFLYHSYSQKQKEAAAGLALTQAMVSNSANPSAETYLKIAGAYPGTVAAQRAQLEGAAALFHSGKFPEAQTQFQAFINANPDGSFTPTALLGVAASLEAQGKNDLAIPAYQKAASLSAGPTVGANAKFAMARVYAAQGKTAESLKLYEEVARTYPNSTLGNDAGLRAMELKTQSSAAPAQSAPAAAAAPFTLTH